ncbi:AraC family transcriptional regulator [Shewanella corallii]|uniref:AraC family transcriptional regulator n=1 Tax=Shewanella corallii TaxID=560080 RepID=A0ABT0NB38_9GAMM|nr:helix-turn-helix domain-containing protein [Shewanella corallii]MCL2915572.1 AraC family transcriptional regulator [Shewanella corallii]
MTNKGNIQSRLERLIKQLTEEISKDWSLADMAASTCLSRFHFHRVFQAQLGLTPAEYLRRLRLERAAHQLTYRKLSVTDIALDNGFESLEGFSRAFKQLVGMSPSAFRRTPEFKFLTVLPDNNREKSMTSYPVEVRQFESQSIALMMHSGPQQMLPQTISRFINWRRKAGCIPPDSRTFNLIYDDPSTVPPQQFRFGLAAGIKHGSIKADALTDDPVQLMEFPRALCAWIPYTGSDNGLGDAVNQLYQWLNDSGREAADFPLFFERIAWFPEVPEHMSETHIYLPLKS